VVLQVDALIGRVTVFAGAGKGCGKTAAFGAAALMAQARGPVALFTIGLDTSGAAPQAPQASGAAPQAPQASGHWAAPPTPGPATGPPAVRVRPGDIVITTAPLARAAEARLDIIDALPGRSAIGRLCVCRAMRAGRVALVGPEHFGQLASAIDMVRRESLAESVLVDGAAGRLTQAGALPDAQVVYCAKADGADYLRVAENIELVSRLLDLPVEGPGWPGGHGAGGLRIEGPLTASVLDGLGKDVTHVSIGSFSDCFLDAPSFGRAARHLEIAVRRRIPLLCFAVALKDISPAAFLAAAPSAAARAAFGLYGA